MDNLYSYKNFICQQLKRKGIMEQDIEDVCHDVFVLALTNVAGYKEGEQFPYLMLQVRQVLSERARRYNTKGRSEEVLIGDWEDEHVPQGSNASVNFNKVYLSEIIPKLSQRMYYALLHSVKEAAEEFGVTRQAIEKDFKKFRLEWAV
jgi:DNA-directed RNA polymerase specialized sigma24 family protein